MDYKVAVSEFTAPVGKEFVKWGIESVNEPGKFEKYLAPDEIYNISEDVELVAIWEIKNPDTSDNVLMYMISAIVSIAAIFGITMMKKFGKQNN